MPRGASLDHWHLAHTAQRPAHTDSITPAGPAQPALIARVEMREVRALRLEARRRDARRVVREQVSLNEDWRGGLGVPEGHMVIAVLQHGGPGSR